MLRVKQWQTIILTIILLVSSTLVKGIAQADVSIYDKLNGYEKELFGKSQSDLSIEKRLKTIEKQVFGKTNTGTTAQRIEAIDKVMNGNHGSTYLPPVAPGIDRSLYAPSPVSPPNKIEESSSDGPHTATDNDKVTKLLQQAMSAYSAGKESEADRLYHQVLSIDFRNTDANFNLGALAERKGDLQGAEHYYSAAYQNSPNDSDIKDALTEVRQKLKSSSVSTINPKIDQADRQIAQEASEAYKAGHFDEAIDKLTKLAAKNPNDANVQFALGQAWRGKGNTSEALKHLHIAATLNPKNDLYTQTLNNVQASTDGKSDSATVSNNDQKAGTITPFNLPQAQQSNSDFYSTGSGQNYGSPGLASASPTAISILPSLATRLIRQALQSGLMGAAYPSYPTMAYPGYYNYPTYPSYYNSYNNYPSYYGRGRRGFRW